MLIDLDRPASQSTLAAIIGVTAQAISKIERGGVCSRDMSVRAWLQAYCLRSREQAAGRARTPLSAERARLAKEQADAKAMENAVRRKELAPVSLLEFALAATCQNACSLLESIPSKLHLRGMRLEDIEVVEALIREARIAAANATIDLSGWKP